tara:strand:+ start:743 stop:1606 length:864 start_codon:yes stop_codon:yes gene_type:complete
MYSLHVYLSNLLYNPEAQICFQDPSTSLMENIIDLHHFIFFFVVVISGLVLWLLFQIIDNFIYSYRFVNKRMSKVRNIYYNESVDNYLIYNFAQLNYKNRTFKENKTLEACWTLFPAVILIIISVPSFYMLYISEESVTTVLTVKVVGYQWYWTYDYTNFFPEWFNIKTDSKDIDDYIIESYMEPEEYLNKEEGSFRLLETDNILILPTRVHLSIIVTSMDVLHSFCVPSLGVKIDAVPGRLNKMDIFIYRMGVFYGQCSEICGIGHGFMPICLHAVSFLNFLIGDL